MCMLLKSESKEMPDSLYLQMISPNSQIYELKTHYVEGF